MGTGRLRVGPAVGLTLIVVCGTAAAQVVHPPDEIRRCLCLEQSIGILQDQFRAQGMAYEQQRQDFEALDEAVQTAQPQVNANNPADVAAFKRLLQKHDDAAATLAGSASRSYTEAVQRYNQALSDYINSGCAGKAFDRDQITAAKQTLSCQ
jgi:hypothetical protein